jgi:hypothetical protein
VIAAAVASPVRLVMGVLELNAIVTVS